MNDLIGSDKFKIVCMDNMEFLKALPDNYADSMVTDPPAGIGFMGKDWDKNKGGRYEWINWLSGVMAEAKRVLKPGAHALVWALPRTAHWTMMALEDAGFEIRDVIVHIYGSGFPKSQNIGKAIDKSLGTERMVIGKRKHPTLKNKELIFETNTAFHDVNNRQWHREWDITAPASEEAHEYEGWGTGLKPASEHWILCRKPISEKTIAANVLKWGTGAINIDDCRISIEKMIADHPGGEMSAKSKGIYGDSKVQATHQTSGQEKGRWPANLTHDGSNEALEVFPESNSSRIGNPNNPKRGGNSIPTWGMSDGRDTYDYRDSGSASRFFYCAKTSGKERNAGLDILENKIKDAEFRKPTGNAIADRIHGCGIPQKNNHPTVKPIELCKYLCRLITPPDGIIIDIFCGSGSIGCGAVIEGFRFMGCDNDPEYAIISDMRIRYWNDLPRQERLL